MGCGTSHHKPPGAVEPESDDSLPPAFDENEEVMAQLAQASKKTAEQTAEQKKPAEPEAPPNFVKGQKVLAYCETDPVFMSRPMRPATVKRDNRDQTVYLVFDETNHKQKRVPYDHIFDLDGKPAVVKMGGLFGDGGMHLNRAKTMKILEVRQDNQNEEDDDDNGEGNTELEVESVEDDYQESFYVQAIADWTDTAEGDLPLKEDQLYKVDHMYPDGWWYGWDADRNRGTFPSNYVKPSHEAPLTFFKTQSLTPLPTSHPKHHRHIAVATTPTGTKPDLDFMAKAQSTPALGSKTPMASPKLTISAKSNTLPEAKASSVTSPTAPAPTSASDSPSSSPPPLPARLNRAKTLAQMAEASGNTSAPLFPTTGPVNSSVATTPPEQNRRRTGRQPSESSQDIFVSRPATASSIDMDITSVRGRSSTICSMPSVFELPPLSRRDSSVAPGSLPSITSVATPSRHTRNSSLSPLSPGQQQQQQRGPVTPWTRSLSMSAPADFSLSALTVDTPSFTPPTGPASPLAGAVNSDIFGSTPVATSTGATPRARLARADTKVIGAGLGISSPMLLPTLDPLQRRLSTGAMLGGVPSFPGGRSRADSQASTGSVASMSGVTLSTPSRR